jgi:ATP-binding cassette, subfamily C, bacterial CydD
MKALKRLLAGTPNVKPALVGIVALGVLGALCTAVQWWMLARALNLVIFERAPLNALLEPLILAALGMGLRALFLGGREAVSSRLGIAATRHWRDALTRASLGAQLRPSSLIAHGLDKLEGYFARFLPSAASMGAVSAVLLVFAFSVDALTGVILLVTAPLIPLLMWLIGVAARDHASAQFDAMQRLGSRFADTLRGFEDLSAMNRLNAQREHIATSSLAWREATMNVLRVAFLNGFALEITATIATAIVAVSSGLRLLHGQLPFEAALLSILIAPEFYAPLRQFGLEHHAGMEAEPVALATLEVIGEEGDVVGSSMGLTRCSTTPRERPQPTTPRDLALEIVHLSFRYDNATLPVLEDVSLTLPRGSRMALVGASGSGKSTLVRVLLRLLEPSRGELYLHGTRAGLLNPETWLESFSWVGQGVHLFHRSVAENLRLANPDATDTELWAALETAQAAEFVAALPRGLDTIIGERGSRLSGGEAQRLAIARALLKDAPILILDEATSSLDAFMQSRVQVALEALMRDRTVLIVAHRLETVKGADQIVVLERGRVAELGTHAQLLERRGAYARLLRAGVNS